jgi:hypothetical protein
MSEDQWQHWRNALAGNVGPIHENEPQSGFYRVRNDPVAIWREGDDLFAERAGRPVADVCALWTYAAKWPITCELYEAVAERGEPWPDAIEEPAGIGHNAEDEHSAITDELAAIEKGFADWLASIGGSIAGQEQADKAATYAERIKQIEKRATEAHKVEKAPHLEAGRVVDARWKPVIASAATAARTVKDAVGVYLIAEKRRRDEAAAKVRAETGAEVEAAPVKTRGAARAVTLRTVKRAEITDLPALAAFIASMERPPEDWVDLTRRLAERMLLAGVAVPGCKITEIQTAA